MAALNSIRTSFEKIGKDLEPFLWYDEGRSTEILSILQQMFQYNKRDENVSGRTVHGCPFGDVATEDLDYEHVWQQIQLQNESLLTQSLASLYELLSKQRDVYLKDKDIHQKVEENLNALKNSVNLRSEVLVTKISDVTADDDLIYRSEDDGNNFSIDEDCGFDPGTIDWQKGSAVDDNFFKLAEMENFLEMEERREQYRKADQDGAENDSDGIDLFTDYNKECEGYQEHCLMLHENVVSKSKSSMRKTDFKRKEPSDYMYEDFFSVCESIVGPRKLQDTSHQGLQKGRENKDTAALENIDSRSESEKRAGEHDTMSKSSFEIQQDKLNQKIKELENSNVASKPWQLHGEASASVRPANSVLEEMLHFEHTTATAPVITEETAKKLEDIIVQRIRDQTWDDVERRVKQTKEPYEYKKDKVLTQGKSKMSLSEIYEKEYLEKKTPLVAENDGEHAEIKKMMKSLFAKLNALSNFHFTPKPPKSEVTIVPNVPSIIIEEPTPVNISEMTLLAPEEIFDKQKIELTAASEQTTQNRKHARRLKKRRQRFVSNEKEKVKRITNVHPSLGNRHTKGKIEEKHKISTNTTVDLNRDDEKALKSSSVFFAKLQDSVRNEIHEKKATPGKKQNSILRSTQIRL